jgi:hypothetical protein
MHVPWNALPRIVNAIAEQPPLSLRKLAQYTPHPAMGFMEEILPGKHHDAFTVDFSNAILLAELDSLGGL